jgi:hypothetical protein
MPREPTMDYRDFFLSDPKSINVLVVNSIIEMSEVKCGEKKEREKMPKQNTVLNNTEPGHFVIIKVKK